MLRDSLQQDRLLIAPGVYDGLSTRLAAAAGFDALYVSGFSVAGATWGNPDIGLVTATEMADAVARIVDVAAGIPVIADADNGYGGPMNVARTVRAYERAGAACLQIEDQVHPKRCGHMAGKEVVDRGDAVLRIRAAVDARTNPNTLIMARTDARATDGLDEALDRASEFLEAGADILFIEAPGSVREMKTICRAFPNVPLVINLVEDGRTPWRPRAELAAMGFSIALMPVTALLHASRVLGETYEQMASVETPPSPRMSFEEFNMTVGLQAANDFTERLSSSEEEES